MDEQSPFGTIAANSLKIGDIVEWSTWGPERENWELNYGIIVEIKNEVKGNRLVSVSVVMPLAGPKQEIEFFTPTLKLISEASQAGD
jgi:hypothetical protein|tara:strand:- start:253 stop:513 length:261 start_codon:yes stop_codon:yes gene_type:complete